MSHVTPADDMAPSQAQLLQQLLDETGLSLRALARQMVDLKAPKKTDEARRKAIDSQRRQVRDWRDDVGGISEENARLIVRAANAGYPDDYLVRPSPERRANGAKKQADPELVADLQAQVNAMAARLGKVDELEHKVRKVDELDHRVSRIEDHLVIDDLHREK